MLLAGLVSEHHDPHTHGSVSVSTPGESPPKFSGVVGGMTVVPGMHVAGPVVCLTGGSAPGYSGDCSGCKTTSTAMTVSTGGLLTSTGSSFIHETVGTRGVTSSAMSCTS